MSPRVFSKFADPDEIAKRPPQSAPPRLEPNLMHTRPDSYAGLRRVCDQGAPERTRFVGAKMQWMCMQTAHECGAVVHTHIEFIQIRDLDRERVQIIPHTHTLTASGLMDNAMSAHGKPHVGTWCLHMAAWLMHTAVSMLLAHV